MVNITELPIAPKFKENFDRWLGDRDIADVSLGNFSKITEGSGNCAVCGHGIKYGMEEHGFRGRHIGICCATNIYALQECKGDFDKLNFERKVRLAKKTIYKRRKKWEAEQKKIQMQIKYSEEFQFCHKVLKDFVCEKELWDRNFFWFGNEGSLFLQSPNRNYEKAMAKIVQIKSWLSWANSGVVNDAYLNQLRELMKQTPKEIVDEFKMLLTEADKKQDEFIAKRKKFDDTMKDLHRLNDCRLSQYDWDKPKSLLNWGYEKNFFTDKQYSLIESLQHKYRNQIQAWNDKEDRIIRKKELEGHKETLCLALNTLNMVENTFKKKGQMNDKGQKFLEEERQKAKDRYRAEVLKLYKKQESDEQ